MYMLPWQLPKINKVEVEVLKLSKLKLHRNIEKNYNKTKN